MRDPVDNAFRASSLSILRQVDHTIRNVAEARRDKYELSCCRTTGRLRWSPSTRTLGCGSASLWPAGCTGYRVEETKGKIFGPEAEHAGGRIRLTYSGGLGHLYIGDGKRRLAFEDVVMSHPELVRNLGRLERIALVMGRSRGEGIFIASGLEYRGAAVKVILAPHDRHPVRAAFPIELIRTDG